jgi:hypothetical protein
MKLMKKRKILLEIDRSGILEAGLASPGPNSTKLLDLPQWNTTI